MVQNPPFLLRRRSEVGEPAVAAAPTCGRVDCTEIAVPHLHQGTAESDIVRIVK